MNYGVSTYEVSVSTPRCVQVISARICSNSRFSLDTRSLACATSDFNKSGSYFVLRLLVLEHTTNQVIINNEKNYTLKRELFQKTFGNFISF